MNCHFLESFPELIENKNQNKTNCKNPEKKSVSARRQVMASCNCHRPKYQIQYTSDRQEYHQNLQEALHFSFFVFSYCKMVKHFMLINTWSFKHDIYFAEISLFFKFSLSLSMFLGTVSLPDRDSDTWMAQPKNGLPAMTKINLERENSARR